MAWKVDRFVGTEKCRCRVNQSTPYRKSRANFLLSIASEVTGIAPERIDPKCQDKIKQSHPVGGEDQAVAREKAEAEAELGAVVVEQVRAESAFVQVVGRGSLMKAEFLASTRNALNAEHLWHGSSHGSM